MGKAIKRKARTVCTFCNKEVIHNQDIMSAGTNVGNSKALGQAVMKKKYGGKPIRKHPLSMPKGKGWGAQAHHLICSESMDNAKWRRVCRNFGYNINHPKNGIILPADMKVACQEHVPLHKGNHADTKTDIGTLSYVQAVKKKIAPILNDALQKDYCKKGKDIIAALNRRSKSIWRKLEKFTWTITFDGRDYKGKKGCRNVRTLSKKRAQNGKGEACKTPHNITIPGKYFLEQQ